MKLTFSGKKVLILGGSCNLAITLSKLLMEEGLYPILSFRSGKGKKSIKIELSKYSEKYETVYIDLKDRSSLKNIMNQPYNSIDYLVDFIQGDFESLIAAADNNDSDRYFIENISRRAEILKTVTRQMVKKKRGRLIFISSTAAAIPNPGQGFYAAAKLAAEALYRNIGIEMTKKGITALTLRPGYINSGRGKEYLKKNPDKLKNVPLNRALSENEVAESIIFFLSDNAIGFNATEILMDGGLTAGK